MKTKIMLVDDDQIILASLKRNLIYDGYDVVTATDGLAAVDMVAVEKPDLVVLDVMMPQMDGWECCPYLRAVSDAPILMLTAKDEVADKVRGLNAGADDYLVKPFAYEEFIARVRALLRRADGGKAPAGKLQYKDLTLDTGQRMASRGDRQIELSTKEYELLHIFLKHPEQVLTRQFLMDRVWGWNYEGESNVLEVYIRYLRAKLEAGGEPRLIRTIRGAGYALRFSAE